jgi:uncharacterized membrane protein
MMKSAALIYNVNVLCRYVKLTYLSYLTHNQYLMKFLKYVMLTILYRDFSSCHSLFVENQSVNHVKGFKPANERKK